MDRGKTESSNLRGIRGSRGTRINPSRGKPSDRPSSPNKNPSSNSNPEPSHPIRGRENQPPLSGSRIMRPRGRGRGRIMRRFNRPRPQNMNRRFRRPIRNQRGMRRRFRRFIPRYRFFRRRMNFPKRSIFIKGLPENVTENNMMDMLRKEGRVIRLTFLKDNQGKSRGMAFAEFQNPSSALNTIKKYRGYKLGENTIFVAFKRDNRNNYPRNFNRNRNYRRFNNFRRGFNPNRFQRQMRPVRNNIRGRGRGSGRGN